MVQRYLELFRLNCRVGRIKDGPPPTTETQIRLNSRLNYAGTPHKPPVLTAAGYCTFESIACADFLLKHNVPAQQLLRETSSYDTIGNGYFAAAIHAIPRRWQHLMVVTSDFHMPRSQAIFETVFGLVEKDLGFR